MRIIQRKDLFWILVRSFYIQGSWNYQRMLNLGFCYSILPVLRKLYKTEEERKSFLKRHMEFFNAHPYFASFALGATARLEEQNCVERWSSTRPITVFKNRLCGPLGAIGDKLFWGTVKPLAAMIGVLATLFWGLAGPILLFIIYNIPHIYLRYYGISKGYKLGFDIVRELSKRKFEKFSNQLHLIGLVILGIFISLFITFSGKNEGILIPTIFIISMVVSFPFIRLKKSIIFPIIINIGLFIGFYFTFGL